YYQYVYSQPFTIATGPAIYNLDSGENTVIDLVGIRERLNVDQGYLIQPILGQYLSSKNVFAVSYTLQGDNEEALGGFLFIAPDGSLLDERTLNFIPTYFVE
ncbi:MAG: hypothetical protein WA810_01735, partial [Maribacter sp.]